MILGTKEWRPHNENCEEGCENDCLYCYAALMAARYHRRKREDWHIMKPNARSKRPVRFLEGGVMFPTTHDLHAHHINWWSPFLTDLLAAGNEVLIVTKPDFAAVRFICDNFHSKINQIEFRFTIGTDEDRTRRYWEPNAPGIGERIHAMRYAFERGYKTSASLEPLLMEDPRRLIWQISPWISEGGTIWIGRMNHYKLNPKIPEEARQITIQSRENLQGIYDSLKDYPQIRWKDSVRDLLGV